MTTRHFYEDYADTVRCSDAIKETVKSRSDADAVFTIFLSLYEGGNYSKGTKAKAIYEYEDRLVSIEPSEGRLFVSFVN